MSNGDKKQIYSMIGMTLIIIVVSSLFQIKWAKQVAYGQLAQVVGITTKLNPNLEKEWMLSFKESDQRDEDFGKQILSKYGYTENNVPIVSTYATLEIALISGAGIIGLAYWYIQKQKKQTKQRIDGLTQYLKLAGKGESRSLQISKEDEFSILEDEVYKTVGELYQTQKNALNDREILKEHIADIAHQLKTPLTSMGMMCELLEETKDIEEGQIYLTKLQNQLQRLDELVHVLLTFSKIDANVVQMEKETVDVYILLLRVLELVEPLAVAKKQSIEIINEATVEEAMQNKVTYEGDMKWSIEALCNLVKNCIEHTPGGKKVMLSYKQNPLYTLILIEDEGEGFVPKEIPYLFKRFYKGKNATKGSIGIGLALAKNIIEKQNGSIEAENREEGGARFIIKIYSKQRCH